jgi:hypothetical protein
MPGVMNRYIRYESAGDQYVGRCVSGQNRLSNDFALSNPYFDFSDLEDGERVQTMREVDAWIKARMPSGSASNERVLALFKFCLASFLFHKNSVWLESNTH